MNAVTYEINHQYQPTNTTCSPTALSMLLGYYGEDYSAESISSKVPQVKNERGENFGTINQQLATWCISLGFKAAFYTFDVQVIDQSWAKLSKEELLARLEMRKSGLVIPSLGKLWNEAYIQSYIDFVKAGGELHIQAAVTSKLLYELLKRGPILPCLSFSTLYGTGRVSSKGELESMPDDINGKAWNHSVVIYGNDEAGRFLLADPWQKPGRHIIEPERMVAAISTAQLECDNLLFQISK